jgi:hypothetical protein
LMIPWSKAMTHSFRKRVNMASSHRNSPGHQPCHIFMAMKSAPFLEPGLSRNVSSSTWVLVLVAISRRP